MESIFKSNGVNYEIDGVKHESDGVNHNIDVANHVKGSHTFVF